MIPHIGKVAKYFYDRFNNIRPSSNGWMEFECPFCGRDKAAVHFEYQRVKCWRGCFEGSVTQFVCMVERVDYRQAVKLVLEIPGEVYVDLQGYKTSTPKIAMEKAIPYPEHFVPLDEPSPIIGRKAVSYLEGRGFSVKRLADKGWGYCDGGRYYGRIIIPFFVHGVLRYYQGRTFINDYLRYDNPKRDDIGVDKGDVIYNESALDLYQEIAIMEGAMDAECWGDSGTSTQGWSVSRWQLTKYQSAKATDITLIPDAGFYAKALGVAMKLAGCKRVRVLNLDPISDEEHKDVNSLGVEAIRKLRDEAKVLTEDDIFNIMLEV